MDSAPLWIGIVACAGSAALGLLPLPRGARLAALGAALLMAPAVAVADAWDGPRVAELRADLPAAPLVALIVLVLVLLLLAAALLLRRHPGLVAPALIAALPFRVPVDLGSGADANLLLPLYAVLAAALLAALLERPATAGGSPPADRALAPGAAAPDGPARLLRWIGPALAAFIFLYALEAAWAEDLTAALRNVAFFMAPFAALFTLLADRRWDAAALRAVVIVLAAEGLIFALVAGVQYATGELFWNDKVISGNEAHPYFRVNSLFWDPNILGRYLTVTMIALATAAAFARRPRTALAAAALFAVLLLALLVTFSQTSLLALLGGLLVLVAARAGLAAGIGAALASGLAVALAVLLVAGGGGLSSEATSGRSGLVEGGLEIFQAQPLVGAGSGSFGDEFRERFGAAEGFATESHTEPVTVAAEQGVAGLLAYGALLAVALAGMLGACGLAWRRRCRGPALAAALLATFAALIVHSLGYAAFLTDPITWAILALAAALPLGAGRRPRAEGPAPHVPGDAASPPLPSSPHPA